MLQTSTNLAPSRIWNLDVNKQVINKKMAFPFPLANCTFDENFCGWRNHPNTWDLSDWILNANNTTTSQNESSKDHTGMINLIGDLTYLVTPYLFSNIFNTHFLPSFLPSFPSSLPSFLLHCYPESYQPTWQSLSHSVTRSFAHSPTHSLTYSSTHYLLTYLLTYFPTYLLTCTYLLTYLLYSLTHSLTYLLLE